MKTIMKKMTGLLVMVLLFSVFLTSCSKKEAEGSGIKLYYLNSQGTGLTTVDYSPVETQPKAQVGELLEQLALQKEDVDYFTPISKDIKINSYALSEGILTIDFSPEYENLTVTNEALLRAAVVKTLMQVKTVKGVTFTILSQPLLDAKGVEVGSMTDDSFLFDYGRGQSQTERATLVLYYATEDGNSLKAIRRTVHYSNAMPMEQIVVNNLAEAPGRDGLMSAIPEGTKVMSVVINENTCYVTLDSGFLNFPEGELREVAVYSIVNSLCELDSISKVQIIVNNEAEVIPVESDRVSGTYEADKTYVIE